MDRQIRDVFVAQMLRFRHMTPQFMLTKFWIVAGEMVPIHIVFVDLASISSGAVIF